MALCLQRATYTQVLVVEFRLQFVQLCALRPAAAVAVAQDEEGVHLGVVTHDALPAACAGMPSLCITHRIWGARGRHLRRHYIRRIEDGRRCMDVSNPNAPHEHCI